MSNERPEWPISEEELHAYVDNQLDPERQHPDAALLAKGSTLPSVETISGTISDDGRRRNSSRQFTRRHCPGNRVLQPGGKRTKVSA
jgi:hypothetical protein